MAEKLKLTKATATPTKPSTRKKTVAAAAKPAATPSREEIARLAEKYWAERGFQDGYAEQDWLRAEQELLQEAS